MLTRLVLEGLAEMGSMETKTLVPDHTVWSSWSVAPFYGALLLIGIVIFFRVR
jgi:hypothetical protein